jgi:hypothetical protein
MARAPQEVLVVEAMPHVVPAAVGGVIVDHSVRSCKFVCRMSEAHHHGRPHPPGEPGEPTGEANEELGVLDPPRALAERPVARLVLGPMRDVVPHQPMARARASGRCK